MPAPTSRTEAALLDYMLIELGPTGVSLGLEDNSDGLMQAITTIERLLGVSDVTTATDMAHLEAAARWQAWLVAEAAATNQYNVTLTGGKKFEREQQFQNIQVRLGRAYTAYLIEQARVDAASGSAAFYFATVAGYRGR